MAETETETENSVATSIYFVPKDAERRLGQLPIHHLTSSLLCVLSAQPANEGQDEETGRGTRDLPPASFEAAASLYHGTATQISCTTFVVFAHRSTTVEDEEERLERSV